METELILHHYWPSPFAHKIRLALAWAEISWSAVEIPRLLPKPLLMPLTAGYRRTPVLQVGADIYCDTQNIARYLGELKSAEKLFPKNSIDQALIFSSWIDQVVFPLCARTVITLSIDTAPSEFIKDRGGLYFGSNWTEETLKSDLSSVILQLISQFQVIDCALKETGGLLGSSFSYADIAIASLAWFLRNRWEGGAEFLAKFPRVERVENQIHQKKGAPPTEISAKDALLIAKDSQSTCQSMVSHWFSESLKVGDLVSITPQAETSDKPVKGKLHRLTETRISIIHQAPEVGNVIIHLPVSGYQVRAIG